MASFFSLGGGRGRGTSSASTTNQQQQQQITPENWLLYRNTTTTTTTDDISYKSFELWQDQAPQHHQQQQQNLYPALSGGVGLGVGVVNFTDQQQQHHHHQQQHQEHESSPRSASAALMMMRQTGATSGGSGGGGGSISCQDCGNQAKKDCVHMRCRTCCKSRGLQCSTHVRSTWVPASKRRERQDQFTSSQQRENPKRLRENRHHNPSSSARNRALNTSSSQGLDIENFPAEVNSPAVFRCVRVGSFDDADEQYAYQTAVNIGGHVFKGILYDHGPDHHGQYSSGPGESSSVGGGGNQQYNVIDGGTNTGVRLAVASSSGGGGGAGTAYLDPNLYPAPLNSFMAGTQFFPPPRT